jgi:uncharacterized membrane protein
MDRLLVVVFDDENSAHQGEEAVTELDTEGSIGLYACAVLSKHADGTTTLKKEGDYGPVGTLLGALVGGVIGLLGGPTGFGIGLATGAVAGGTVDLNTARIGTDFIEDVKKALAPNKFALVAEIEEVWAAPVDTRMEALGGTVFRRSVSDVKHTLHEEQVVAMKADLAQMKAEQAQARADRKAKLQEKINQLESKIQAHLQKDKERREAAEREEQAKVQVLKTKAAAIRAKAS